jgi:cell wall assembly regulator SMI1
MAQLELWESFAGKWRNYQARDKRWKRIRWTKKVIEVVEGGPGLAQKEVRKEFASDALALTYAKRFDTKMHNSLFRHVTKIVTSGKLATPTSSPAEKRQLKKEMDALLARAAAKEAEGWPKFFAESKKQLRPSARGGDGAAVARQLSERASAMSRHAGVNVRLKVGKPASQKAIARTEKVLGIALPPSLRSYLAAQDGATVLWDYPEKKWGCAFTVLGTKALQETHREVMRSLEQADAHHQQLMTHLRPIFPSFDGAQVALDTRVASKSGEYAVVFLARHYSLEKGYVVLAPDFATFLKTCVADHFLVRGVPDVLNKHRNEMRRKFK